MKVSKLFIYYNPNPYGRNTSDCVVRAISKLMDTDWDTTFIRLSIMALRRGDNLERGHVWGTFLRLNGYKRYFVPDMCPDCYTVKDFCAEHPKGRYLLRIDGLKDGHVVAVVDGDYYDSLDSGNEPVEYYYE